MRGHSPGSPPTLHVSIVVPYYNPGNRLRTTVEDMVRVLDASGMTFEIITVSDGSTDGSPFTLEGFPESVVRRMNFAKNFGKGHALRAGLGLGRGRYLGFIDADGDISPELLAPFVSIMQSEQPDIIIGSKRHPESSVHSRRCAACTRGATSTSLRCSSGCTSRTPRSGSSSSTAR